MPVSIRRAYRRDAGARVALPSQATRTEGSMTADYATKRDELRRKHADARARRDRAVLGSDEHKAAAAEVGRIEVELAKLAREQDPPLV